MALKIGERIGDYEIVELLGTGGMGTVYRARNAITHREEALKVVLPELRWDPDLAERFAREIRIQASLDHPNIAALRTALRLGDQLLMVIELIDGITLDQRLRASRIELVQGVGWMVETLTALAYAHGRGILHCDVKPGNIMITTQNKVKLMDFGIARSMADSGMTRGGMALGSRNYIAPELIQGEEPDARSDIYSVGATLYEVVTGEKAFQGKTDYEVMKAHLEHQPPSPETRNPDVSPDLGRAIMRAISKRREERFQTADEFLLALKRVGSLTVPLKPESAVAAVASSATSVRMGKTASATSPQGPSSTTKRTWDEATLNRITKELSKYVGPLARVLVNRAAKTCTSVSELYDTLANEIPSWEDRERFMENRPPRI